MLKIDRQVRDRKVVLVLEGRLVDCWVELLGQSCSAYRPSPQRPLILELSGVRFASREGVDLLRRLRQEGAVLVGARPFLWSLCDRQGGEGDD